MKVKCGNCGGKLHVMAAREPWNPEHLSCGTCYSTYPMGYGEEETVAEVLDRTYHTPSFEVPYVE